MPITSAVEKALQRHIQDEIEDMYLESLLDEDTQLIQEDIPDVLDYLFDLYGKVPSKEVKQKEAEIRAMVYHPADPMILLFNPIEKLKKMAIAADIKYTAGQILDIALMVVRNTRDFERALRDWEALPPIQKTWDNFKTHFNEAQKQLRASRGPTMQQEGYHHANHLAQQLKSDIQQQDSDLLTYIQTAINSSSHSDTGIVTNTATPSDMSAMTPVQYQANAAQTDMVQFEMLKILQQIQQSLTTTDSQPQPNSSTNRRTRTRGPRKTPDNASFNRNKMDKYC